MRVRLNDYSEYCATTARESRSFTLVSRPRSSPRLTSNQPIENSFLTTRNERAKVDLRSSRSLSALVSSTNDRERILRHTENTEYFTTAREEASLQGACNIDKFNQRSPTSSQVGREEQTMDVYGRLASREELQSLIGREIRKLESTQIKEGMLVGVEETLAETVNMGFNAVSTDVKPAFFGFIEMAIIDMAHHGLLYIPIQTAVERWTQSKKLMNVLAEKICNHQVLTDRVAKIAISNEVCKGEVPSTDHGTRAIVPPHLDSSCKAFDNDFFVRRENTRRLTGKKESTNRAKVKKRGNIPFLHPPHHLTLVRSTVPPARIPAPMNLHLARNAEDVQNVDRRKNWKFIKK